MKKTSRILYESAENFGLLFTLDMFGSNLKFKIPLGSEMLNMPIDELQLSVRSRNGLMRSSASHLRDVYEIVMSETGLGSIRNLGKKSIGEIKTALLAIGYSQLGKLERAMFWQDFVNLNNLPDDIIIAKEG